MIREKIIILLFLGFFKNSRHDFPSALPVRLFPLSNPIHHDPRLLIIHSTLPPPSLSLSPFEKVLYNISRHTFHLVFIISWRRNEISPAPEKKNLLPHSSHQPTTTTRKKKVAVVMTKKKTKNKKPYHPFPLPSSRIETIKVSHTTI